MSPKAQQSPFLGKGSNSTVQGLQNCKPRHTPEVHNVSRFSSFSSQGQPDSPHGHFFLSSRVPSNVHQVNPHVAQWAMEQGIANNAHDQAYRGFAPTMACTLDGQVLPVTTTSQDMAFPTPDVDTTNPYGNFTFDRLSAFDSMQHIDDPTQHMFVEHSVMHAHSYATSTAPEYKTPSDSRSNSAAAYPSPTEPCVDLLDHEYAARDFDTYNGGAVVYMPSNVQQTAPISPPLSEPSLNLSLTTSCPQWSTSFQTTADASTALASPDTMFQTQSMIEDMYSMEHDFLDSERTWSAPSPILQSLSILLTWFSTSSTKPHRPILSASTRSESHNGGGAYSNLAMQDPIQQRVTDGAADRQHPAYYAEPSPDGLYHCPWAVKDNCQHKPVKQKCNFQWVESFFPPLIGF